MNFVEPTPEELADLRADPLLFEQELDVRPSVASALEKALGFRAGRRHWRARSGHLYAIDLGDFGRGRPSMALVYGFWPSFAPRPLTDEAIDEDLADLCLWIADITDDMQPEVMAGVLDLTRAARSAGNDFRLPL
ncbi:hypothetical protein [Pseudonocardia spinosispora]|uniref:hypothetical protein n=1 Tax=Pseudonocardia spinosispora TaxID=103441 RepID=UPI0003F57A87|nr:hypothetical protein [Pseudonocardia spinosispora]